MDHVINLGKHLTEAAARYPEEIGLIQGSQEFTWKHLNARVDAFAQALQDMQIEKGDVVFVQSPNNAASYELIYSTAKIGAIYVPVNFRAHPAEVKRIAAMCTPKAFVVHEDTSACAKAALAACNGLKNVIVIGTLSAEQKEAGWSCYEELVLRYFGACVPCVAVHHSDPHSIGFSSGSTGDPKAIVNTFGQYAYTITERLANVMDGVTHKDAFLAIGPLSHGSGTVARINTSRAAKTVMLSTSSFMEEECLQLIEKHRITSLFLVPTMLVRLIKHPSFANYDISSLKHVVYAGASISRQDQKLAIEKLGWALIQYYGSGETLGHGTVLRPEQHTLIDKHPNQPVDTIGFPRTGTDIEIMDENMEPVRIGEEGLLCIRRGPGVFGGYFQDTQATTEVFRGDWYVTGDIAKSDEHGYLYIMGRAKDMYKSGGLQVFPKETEECLIRHPAVSEAYVIPFSDSEWGEVGIAVAILNENTLSSESELKQHLRNQIAAYKLPKRIFILDSVEKAETGKVLKHKLKQEILARRLVTEGVDVR